MKPRLRKVFGLWYCLINGVWNPTVGIGFGPTDAYDDWKRQQ